MGTFKRLKQITFSLGIIGFIAALFLWGQATGLGMETDTFKEISSRAAGSGSNLGLSTFEESALRYCFISVCFFLFIIFVQMRNKIFLKATGLIPLIFVHRF
jgi:hypothetical protein